MEELHILEIFAVIFLVSVLVISIPEDARFGITGFATKDKKDDKKADKKDDKKAAAEAKKSEQEAAKAAKKAEQEAAKAAKKAEQEAAQAAAEQAAQAAAEQAAQAAAEQAAENEKQIQAVKTVEKLEDVMQAQIKSQKEAMNQAQEEMKILLAHQLADQISKIDSTATTQQQKLQQKILEDQFRLQEQLYNSKIQNEYKLNPLSNQVIQGTINNIQNTGPVQRQVIVKTGRYCKGSISDGYISNGGLNCN